jgi:hypothetical protein
MHKCTFVNFRYLFKYLEFVQSHFRYELPHLRHEFNPLPGNPDRSRAYRFS